ncbi:MAG: phosphopyruvate hydratase, partial [Candidatus Shapirobacteria bacterium]|nr:phosphopyruvate hydratase [Candidatus Shapirobacteria bacterium]
MSKIKNIYAREILASGGAPSLEVTVTLESGAIGEASVSYGASAGSKEATVLLDGDAKRYNGKGMLNAIANINTKIKEALIEMEAASQREIDEKMIALDGTVNKAVLGGNAMLGVSLAVCRAEAEEEKMPLYKYLRKTYGIGEIGWKLPKPMIVMIEGGKHADETTDLQEFMIGAMGDKSAAENVRMEMEIYN